ncbi:MAG TPA: energy transducer TonB, partial [Allosphingosinicella sp.]|nr:energy transducer TonB [Allosphingosinicella sp.]
MAEGGFLERRRVSPSSLTIVILLHSAAITALAMSKMNIVDLTKKTKTEVYDVPIPPDPEPV